METPQNELLRRQRADPDRFGSSEPGTRIWPVKHRGNQVCRSRPRNICAAPLSSSESGRQEADEKHTAPGSRHRKNRVCRSFARLAETIIGACCCLFFFLFNCPLSCISGLRGLELLPTFVFGLLYEFHALTMQSRVNY